MDSKNEDFCVNVYENMKLVRKEVLPETREWLTEHKFFDCWIDGKYLRPDKHASSEIILGGITCQVADGHYAVKTALPSSIEAQSQYVQLDLLQRQTLLEKVAKELESKKTLFRNLYDLQFLNNDFDLFMDYFNFYSSITGEGEIIESEPAGVVLIIISDITPPWFLAMATSAALWAGCSVVVNPSTTASISTFLLAELCTKVGFPDGLINVVPGSSDVTKELCGQRFDTIVYSGNYLEGCRIQYMVPLEKLSLFICGHTSFIIFESGDTDAAIDKLFSETWGYSKQREWSADLVVVQESISQTFTDKLTRKLKNIDISNKDLKYNTKLNLPEILELAKNVGFKVYAREGSDQILVHGYDLQAITCEPDAPITKLMVFKTAKDAVGIVNNNPFCIGTSIWTQNVDEAMEVSLQLETCTKWINCHGVMDASVPVQVLRKSGTGVFGGFDGGLTYMVDHSEVETENLEIDECDTKSKELEKISQHSNSVFMKWKLNNDRKKHLMKILDKIELTTESNNVKHRLRKIINFWAHNGNSYKITAGHGKDNNIYPAQRKEPLGVIAMIINNNQERIETFVSWVAPAIIMGNVAIVVLSEKLIQDFEPIIKCFVDNLPNGVVKIIKGIHQGQKLIENSLIQAVWLGNMTPSFHMDDNSTFKHYWSPPSPVPMSTRLFSKHCLKSSVIWFPAINRSG